jgi:glutathione S-transferase
MTKAMLTLWGRPNSVNVQKVLWLCDELALPIERIDAGLQYGRNHEPEYLAMNPNARVPTLVDGDYVLWESNSIMRYLALQYGAATTLYAADPQVRAGIDRWLDWTLSTLTQVDRPVFWALVRTPPEKRNLPQLAADAAEAGKAWTILDQHLAKRDWIEGQHFSLADIAIGSFARRYLAHEAIDKPPLPNVAAWFTRIESRGAFQRHIAAPMT